MVDWDEILYLNQELLKHGIDSNRNEVQTMEIVLAHKKSRKYLLNFLQNMPKVALKNEESAKKYRNKANVLFSEKKVHASIEFYTKAICCAAKGSTELGLSHANRGLALMKVHRFAEAYQDCQAAIDANYPTDKLIKVLLRKATCSAELQDAVQLAEDLKQIDGYRVDQRLGGKDADILGDLQRKLESLSISGPSCDVDSKNVPPKLTEMYHHGKGRYTVAPVDIAEGELITFERAVIFVPVYEERQVISYDCQNCASVNIVPFPCDECKLATYCSPRCRKTHVEIHGLECRGYRMNLWSQIGIAHLAARAFIVGLDQILAACNGRTFDSPTSVFQYLSTDFVSDERFNYGKVFSLLSNFDGMSLENYSCYATTALLLTIYFQSYTNFFPLALKKILGNTESQEVFAGALILRNIGQLVCNGHAITSIRTTLPSIENCYDAANKVAKGCLHIFLRIVRAFTGIFPRISMLNHSCDPNIRNRMEQDRLEIYATRPIMAGGEVFNCYGPHYQQQSTSERRQLLMEQYSFVCECEKCREADAEDGNYSQFLCQNTKCARRVYVPDVQSFQEFSKKVQCRHCEKVLNLKFARVLETHLQDENWIELLRHYKKSAGYLNKTSDYNLNFVFAILNQLMSEAASNDLHESLLELAIDLTKIRQKQFGILSLEFVKDCTYVLDLMAVKKVTNTLVDNVLMKVKQSLSILPKSIENIYVSYMENYLK